MVAPPGIGGPKRGQKWGHFGGLEGGPLERVFGKIVNFGHFWKSLYARARIGGSWGGVKKGVQMAPPRAPPQGTPRHRWANI
jgi:hypothetical protein